MAMGEEKIPFWARADIAAEGALNQVIGTAKSMIDETIGPGVGRVGVAAERALTGVVRAGKSAARVAGDLVGGVILPVTKAVGKGALSLLSARWVAISALVVGVPLVARGMFGRISIPYDLSSPHVSWGSPNMYGEALMEFYGGRVNRYGDMGAHGSLMFALHNTRKA